MNFTTITPSQLTIGASNFDACPMSYLDGEERLGYEPDVARAVCGKLGLKPVWLNLPMADFYSTLEAKQCDVVWFNQAITKERCDRANFTQPYGLFDEAVIVPTDSAIHSPEDLAGLRVGGLANSTNLELAKTFPDVEIVPFPGSDKVLPEMLEALRQGKIDALVDDELVLIPPAETDQNLRVAFSVPTQCPYGIAVRFGEEELLQALNDALSSLIADGTLAEIWQRWIPQKPFPL